MKFEFRKKNHRRFQQFLKVSLKKHEVQDVFWPRPNQNYHLIILKKKDSLFLKLSAKCKVENNCCSFKMRNPLMQQRYDISYSDLICEIFLHHTKCIIKSVYCKEWCSLLKAYRYVTIFADRTIMRQFFLYSMQCNMTTKGYPLWKLFENFVHSIYPLLLKLHG